MDSTMEVINKLAEALGTDYLTMQKAIGVLNAKELLILSTIAISRASQKI